MGKTLLTSREIGEVRREDFNVTTTGQAVITKVIAGTNITISQTGVDAGSGDVTINATNLAAGLVAGTNTQIQFNDSNAFGADADFAWNKATNELLLTGVDTGLTVTTITNEPPSPAANQLHIYTKSIAGKPLMKIKDPAGSHVSLQSSVWQNSVYLWNPTSVVVGDWLGTVGAGTGTYAYTLPTDVNTYTSTRRGKYSNVVTTLNQVLGQRNTDALFYRGSTVTAAGGFFFFARVGFDAWTNGGRFFAGMHSGTTVISADPSALNNTVGFSVDVADNGLISFLTRGTLTSTKASTGFTIAANKGYDLYFYCAPGSSQYTWRIVDITTNTELSGTALLNLPTNNVKLTAGVLSSNGSLITANAIQMGINKIYVETDY